MTLLAGLSWLVFEGGSLAPRRRLLLVAATLAVLVLVPAALVASAVGTERLGRPRRLALGGA